MGPSLSIPCDPCINKISHWLDERIAYVHDLKKNLEALEEATEELKAKRNTLSRRVRREEDRGLQSLAEVQVWLDKVETIETKVNVLINARDIELQKLCLCAFCSTSLISSYRYGRNVILTLRDVNELNKRDFSVTADQPQTSEVEEIQTPPIIVGQETMLEKAWNHLVKEEVGIIAMHGMGGVGKTTLLKQINNKFTNERSGFDFVIWVVVSKELQVEKIQDEVARKVGLGGGDWNQIDKGQKRVRLYNYLRKKKFVLFLDDIWEKVELEEIGIPDPTTQNRCKVVFTTPSFGVCTSMMVEDPMEVKCLSENEAFDLFQKRVGEKTLGSDPEIPDLARKVAKKCHGLPLALNVIGGTMSGKRKIQEWNHAIKIKFDGMEDKIIRLLKYSYDNLKREHVRSCLLYCALFPEDDEIRKGDLIGEGIIDASEGTEMAENEGYDVIGSLVRQSLLTEDKVFNVDGDERQTVRMHDVVREIALWIASDFGKQKERPSSHEAALGYVKCQRLRIGKGCH